MSSARALDLQVVAPAPGMPASLEQERDRFKITLRTRSTGLDDIHNWANGLALEDACSGETAPLTVDSISFTELDSLGSMAAGIGRLPPAAGQRWVQLQARPLSRLTPHAPRTVRMFHLNSARGRERRNAVAAFAPGQRLRLAFASDIHIATFWDRIFAAIDRYAPELSNVALHPSRQLRRFVEECNRRARAGELDLVVFGGDLVDHVYVEPRADVERGRRATNVEVFLDLLAPLEVPFVAIPGNHDYRLFPWRPRVYSMASIGLSEPQRKRVLSGAGWWDRWPLTLRDLDALRTEEVGHDPPLTHHFEHLAPATDFHLDVRGLRLVFANSGRDVIPRWRRVERSRLGLLARSLPGTWVDPDSEGLFDDQAKWLADGIAGAPAAAVFVHAPLLHPRPHRAPAVLDLDPGDQDGGDFEQRLQATGQRNGTIFRNPGAILRALLNAPGPAALFSGHVHKTTNVSLGRRSRKGRIADLTAPADSDTIPIVTTPSLSHHRRSGGEGPGHLLATFDDGRLVALEHG